MCSSIIKVTSLLILLFSSSVYSQSIRDRLDDIQERIDDIEQQRLIDKMRRDSDDFTRRMQELQRQQPQINPPIYSTPQVASDFHYIVRTISDNISGDIFLIKSSIKRQSNNIIFYQRLTLWEKPITFDDSKTKKLFKSDYMVESITMNCNNNTSHSSKIDLYLRDCISCKNKKLIQSRNATSNKFFPIKNNDIEFHEFNYLCR